MASPSLFSQGFSLSAGLTDTTFSPTLSTHAAGDLIEVDVGADGNIGISITGGSGGWTKVWELQNTTGSTTPTMAKFYKLAASSSETLDLTGTAGEAWAASSRVYRGAGGTLNYYSPTPVNGTDSGSGTDGQGSAVNPGAGTQDFTFTQCMVMDGIQGTNAAPSGYGNYQTNNNAAAARVDVSTAELASTATGNTPAAWDSNAEQWIVGGGAVWETSGGTTHAATGALVGPGSTVAGSAAHIAIHGSSGALTGPGSSVVGSAARTRVHPSSGVLTGQGSTVAGSAARTRVHPSSGVLTGQGSTVAGSAARTRQHPASGALTGPGSTIAGSAARTHVHPSSGALVGPGSEIVGSADRSGSAGVHDASGALVGQGSAVAGSAARLRAFASSGALVGPGSVIAGDATRVPAPVTHDASGDLVGPGSLIVGAAVNGTPSDIPMGGGFFTQAMRRRLFEEEMREKLKELPQEVAEVIETTVIDAIDRPKLPTTKEIRRALEVENLPYREAYRKAVVSLVQEMRQIEEDDEEEAIALAFLF